MFAHWLIFVIPKYAIEALAKKKGWTGDFGRWALKERKWLGDAPFDKKDDRIVDAHLYEVNETGHLQHANPQIFISKGNGRPPIPFDKESPDITLEESKRWQEDIEALQKTTPFTKMTVNYEVPGKTSGGGIVNEKTDILSGWLGMDWKGFLINVPVALWFRDYINNDYKKMSNQWEIWSQNINHYFY